MTDATHPCRKCGQDYVPRPYQWLSKEWICQPCIRAKQRAYRRKRKAEGRPVVSGKVSKEYKAAYEREVRSKRPADQLKNATRWQTRRAIANGTLVKQPCEVCGALKVEAHHDDYSKPLDVRWLCRIHHIEHHNRERAEALPA